jgi:hypothetical protein
MSSLFIHSHRDLLATNLQIFSTRILPIQGYDQKSMVRLTKSTFFGTTHDLLLEISSKKYCHLMGVCHEKA